jgi:hypothetical protein
MSMIDDSELYKPMSSPICDLCRHRAADRSRTCSAFPDGIPMPIWLARHDHRTPYTGDHGIRWEPLRTEDIAILKAIAGGESPAPGLSVADTVERGFGAEPVGAVGRREGER